MSPEECRTVFEMLSEYIDGDLPVDVCEHINQHIAGCAPCVQFVESLRKSVSAFRDFRPQENPAPLTDEAKAELARAYAAMLARRQSATPAR